jgi:hypothetical protein
MTFIGELSFFDIVNHEVSTGDTFKNTGATALYKWMIAKSHDFCVCRGSVRTALIPP